nr:TraB/GumN family protein [Flavobacterium haoranii]
MEKAMKDKPTFFGVGAAHLAGEEGVIKLLRKQGYKVEPVK